MTTKHTFKENVLRVVAVLGLLAILLLGAWGIIQLAFFISSFFSNAGGAASDNTPAQTVHESMTISVPQSANAGSPITISWGHQGAAAGAYAYGVSYSCVDGLTFKAPVPTGATAEAPCDKPFNYTQATSSMTLTPVYSGTTDAKVTITVVANKLSSGTITTSAQSGLTVLATKKAPAKTTTTTKKSTAPKTTYTAANRTAALYGYADLAVQILSVNSQGGNATMQFAVTNLGTNTAAANWSFNAILPINGSFTYPSGPQRAMYPGDKIVYTLNFSDYDQSAYTNNTQYNYGYNYNQYDPYAQTGGANWYSYQPCGNCGQGGGPTIYGNGYGTQKSVTIQLDPYNLVPETNEANNTAYTPYTSY